MSPEEVERYARQLMLRDWGGPGQQRLHAASVSIVGAGALGGPCALYLAGAGVGRIEIVDDDTVSLSNLHRQVQFTTADVGQPKAVALARRLSALNPQIEITARRERFGEDTALSGDLVIDATDNFPARFALNAYAHKARKTLVSGAVSAWAGQVLSIRTAPPVASPCYACFVPEDPETEVDCAVIGAAGPVTGMIATRMALDTVRILMDTGASPFGALFILDGLSGNTRTVKLQKDPVCPVCSSH